MPGSVIAQRDVLVLRTLRRRTGRRQQRKGKKPECRTHGALPGTAADKGSIYCQRAWAKSGLRSNCFSTSSPARRRNEAPFFASGAEHAAKRRLTPFFKFRQKPVELSPAQSGATAFGGH